MADSKFSSHTSGRVPPSAATQQVELTLHLSPERFLAYYQGTAQSILARAKDGRSIRFPCSVVQPFVTREGVQGDFVLELDENNRFVRMRRA